MSSVPIRREKRNHSSQELTTEWEMGGSSSLRKMPQVQVQPVHWLQSFLPDTLKQTNKKTGTLSPGQRTSCELEPQHIWGPHVAAEQYMTWGHCHLVLNVSPEGKLTFERDKKLLHVMPAHPLLFHWKVWEHVNSTDMSSCSYTDVSRSLPAQCQYWKPHARTCARRCHLLFSISALTSFPSTFWIEVSVEIEERSEKFRSHGLGRCLISSLLKQQLPYELFFIIHSPRGLHACRCGIKTIQSPRDLFEISEAINLPHSDLDL